MNFILDANVFMEAARRYYPFDFALPFWNCLVDNSKSGLLATIDKVRLELLRGKDDLTKWAKGEFMDAFISTDNDDVISMYGSIMQWIEKQDYTDAAKSDFASGADGWLIAYSKISGCKLVTHETYDPNRKNKIKIPNICRQFNVKYLNTFDMLRSLGFKFK